MRGCSENCLRTRHLRNWAISSGVEHHIHTVGVASSKLASPTSSSQTHTLFFEFGAQPNRKRLRCKLFSLLGKHFRLLLTVTGFVTANDSEIPICEIQKYW